MIDTLEFMGQTHHTTQIVVQLIEQRNRMLWFFESTVDHRIVSAISTLLNVERVSAVQVLEAIKKHTTDMIPVVSDDYDPHNSNGEKLEGFRSEYVTLLAQACDGERAMETLVPLLDHTDDHVRELALLAINWLPNKSDRLIDSLWVRSATEKDAHLRIGIEAALTKASVSDTTIQMNTRDLRSQNHEVVKRVLDKSLVMAEGAQNGNQAQKLSEQIVRDWMLGLLNCLRSTQTWQLQEPERSLRVLAIALNLSDWLEIKTEISSDTSFRSDIASSLFDELKLRTTLLPTTLAVGFEAAFHLEPNYAKVVERFRWAADHHRPIGLRAGVLMAVSVFIQRHNIRDPELRRWIEHLLRTEQHNTIIRLLLGVHKALCDDEELPERFHFVESEDYDEDDNFVGPFLWVNDDYDCGECLRGFLENQARSHPEWALHVVVRLRIDYLNDSDSELRLYIVDQLRHAPVHIPFVVSTLSSSLFDDAPDVRAKAAESLETFGPKTNAAIPALQRVADQDPELTVRVAAQKALEVIQRP